VGPAFLINTKTFGGQHRPRVASDALGNAVVVWVSDLQEPGDGVYGQRYASSGAPLGTEFHVNTYVVDDQIDPAVSADTSGNFVVVWMSDGQDGWSWGVFGQRYANSGAPLGPEFRVNTQTAGIQDLPSIASDSSGNFVVVWQSQGGYQYSVFGQRYAGSGVPLGPEFRVSTYASAGGYLPDVASDASGNFVVVWLRPPEDIFGQRFANSGAPLGPEFLVNTVVLNATNFIPLPRVASGSSGNFVVVWERQDGSGLDVFGQRFASSGAPVGSEFRVNTYIPYAQGDSAVASDTSGNFVVVWVSYPQDGSSSGVFGQRYSQIVPVELMHFRVE